MSLKNQQNPYHFLQILLLVQFFRTMQQSQISKIFTICPIFGCNFSIRKNWFGEFAICVNLLSRFVMLWSGLVLLLFPSFYHLKIAPDEICRYQAYTMRTYGVIPSYLTYNNDHITGYDITVRRDYCAGYQIGESHPPNTQSW